MNRTKIEWTDYTWNPIKAWNLATRDVGHYCEKISPACANCYAATWNVEQRHKRKDGRPSTCGTGVDFVKANRGLVDIFLDYDELERPLRMRKPQRIFACDMTDLFLDHHRDDQIAEVFAWMRAACWHTFHVLTKRPRRMHDLLRSDEFRKLVDDHISIIDDHAGESGLFYDRCLADTPARTGSAAVPARNIWFGITAENQATFDERWPWLRDSPVAVRFVSYEPALGPIDWSDVVRRKSMYSCTGCEQEWDKGEIGRNDVCPNCGSTCEWTHEELPQIDQIIVGGESGGGARAMHPRWVRDARDQCRRMGVSFFFKQWGDLVPPDQAPEGGVPIRSIREYVGVMPDGRQITGKDVIPRDAGAELLCRVGKRRAGRLLDGREWNEAPILSGETRPVPHPLDGCDGSHLSRSC
jgi:protein gp37